MLTVNLISARRAERLRYRTVGELLVRVVVFLALGVFVLMVMGMVQLHRGEQEIAQTNLAQIAYRTQADEVKQLRTLTTALTPQVDAVRKVDRHLDHWRYLYAQLARSVPEDVLLDNVGISKAGSGDGIATLNLEGHGDSAAALSKWILSLNSQPGFSNVSMGQVTMSTPHRATVTAKAPIKPLPEDVPPPPAPPTGPK